MLILLPPSEGKSAPLRGNPLDLGKLSFPALTEARAEVLDALVRLCGGPDPALPLERAAVAHIAGDVLGLGKTQHDEVLRNASLYAAPTARADKVYTGVLYEALDLASLDPVARRRATSWVAITSSLFGLVRLCDPVPAYRLAGDVSLPALGGVAAHWRDALDDTMREEIGGGLLVDLRSSTYAGFWRASAGIAPQVATVRVLHEADGERKVVSHFNKATKGRLVRELVEHGTTPSWPGELAEHLRGLGWTVELGKPRRTGTQLDVIVTDL